MLHEQFKLELLAAPNSASGGEMYRSLLAFLQEQVSKAVLGRSDAADATSGKLGNAQDSMQVRQDILESDAAELAATLNAQLFQPFIDLNFGPQAAYPVFAFHFPEVEDKTLLLQLLRDQVPLGLKVEQSIIRDKFNLPDPPDGAELLGANTPSTPVDRTSPAANRALNRAAGSAHVEKAIAEGTTIQTFRKDFERIVAERGWTGWTGEDTKAGRAWRTRVIYDTNLFTSYSAGRFRQIKEVADLHHYWRYRHSPASVEPRPEHVAWDGIILRHDDPWWTTHYPPGGFGCKCYVETLAERDLKKQGLAVTDKEQILFNGKDPKTGVPLGIDKGWDYQPGANRATPLYDLIARKLPNLGAPLGAAMWDALKDAVAMERQQAWWNTLDDWLADARPRGRTAIVGGLDREVLGWLNANGFPMPATAEIGIRDNLPAGAKQKRHEADQTGLTLEEWRALPGLIDKPGAIYRDRKSGKLIFVAEEFGPTKAAVEFDPKKTKGGINLIVSAFRVSDEAIAGAVKGEEWEPIQVPGRRAGVEPA